MVQHGHAKNSQPTVKVIKQAAELDKIDPGEEKKDDKGKNDEAEELCLLRSLSSWVPGDE